MPSPSQCTPLRREWLRLRRDGADCLDGAVTDGKSHSTPFTTRSSCALATCGVRLGFRLTLPTGYLSTCP